MFNVFTENESQHIGDAQNYSGENSGVKPINDQNAFSLPHSNYYFDMDDMIFFDFDLDTTPENGTATIDKCKSAEQLVDQAKQDAFVPLMKHKRRTTQPVSKPKPVLSNSRRSRTKENVFTIRKERKIPSNQPEIQPPEEGSEDERFFNACNDKTFVINPFSMGFIPSKYWPNENIPFGDIVADFFQRKNNANCRFSHKLFNAIQISKYFPDLKFFSGVEWIGSKVLKVNKRQFARLLGIHSIDGSLFHHQGNFSTHGFVEVSEEEATQIEGKDIGQIDFSRIRLLIHQAGVFVRDVTEEQLNQCKWVSSKKKGIDDYDIIDNSSVF